MQEGSVQFKRAGQSSDLGWGVGLREPELQVMWARSGPKRGEDGGFSSKQVRFHCRKLIQVEMFSQYFIYRSGSQ